MIARSEGTEILTVVGAFGDRPVPLSGQWSRMPDVPPPERCLPRPMMDRHEGTISSRMEMLHVGAPLHRLAVAPSTPDGPSTPTRARTRVTATPRCGCGSPACRSSRRRVWRSSATSCRSGSGRRSGSAPAATASTTRCASRTSSDCDWVLADIRVHAVQHGFGHGLVHLWPRTACCSAPRASPRWCASGRTRAARGRRSSR